MLGNTSDSVPWYIPSNTAMVLSGTLLQLLIVGKLRSKSVN